MRSRTRSSALLICALAAVVAFPGTASAHTLQQDVDSLVAAGAPGAVLLVRDGGRTTRFTSGSAELATRTPMTARDHYRIASLTKTYVAAVVLQLAAEGRLRLDDTLERWVPGVVPAGDRITIRMLLNHTSGLYDHERDPEVLAPYLAGDLGHYWSPLSLLKLAASRPPHYPPGETDAATYSSTNYVALGLVVSAVTHRSIGAELRQRIFRPLHLRHTSYPTRDTRLPEPYAHGYFMLEPPVLTDLSAFSPSLSGPAGAIVSTVGDVARFYRALLSGRVVGPAQLRIMKTTLPDRMTDLEQRMGHGLIEFTASCGPAWGHSGSFPGYWTHAWSSADGTRQMVLMVNVDPTAATPQATAAFYRTLDDAYCATKGRR